MYKNFAQNNVAPVNVGDELDVKIEALGEKGDGIAKKSGFVLFVPNVKEGDIVKIKINRVLKKVGFAEVIGEGKLPAEKPREAPSRQVEEEPQEEIEISEEDMENDSEDFGEDDESDDESSEDDEDFDDDEDEEKKD